MISGRDLLWILSRSQVILIKTFSPSTGRGLSKTAQFGSFAVFAGRFNLVVRDRDKCPCAALWLGASWQFMAFANYDSVDPRSCFDGARAINTIPMSTRTATPISSSRATMLRHAWVPMSAA